MQTSMVGKRNLVSEARAMLEHSTGWHIRRVARLTSRALDAALAPSGFNSTQFGLMALVAGAEDDRLGDLARRAGMDLSTLTRGLALLDRDGLVEIAKVERDRRRRAVWLTEAGARRLEAAIPLWNAAHARLNPRLASLQLEAIDDIIINKGAQANE